MGLNKDKVELENYTSKWKEMYEEEAIKLKEILKDILIDIEHVGSTSIPNLKSKPIIDIAISVKNLKEVEKYAKSLEDAGYSFRYDNGEKGEYLVRKGDEDNRTHYIHIVEENSEKWLNFILFKKHLLAHPEVVKEYEDLKVELSNKYKDDRKSYTKAKNEFIANIINIEKNKR